MLTDQEKDEIQKLGYQKSQIVMSSFLHTIIKRSRKSDLDIFEKIRRSNIDELAAIERTGLMSPEAMTCFVAGMLQHSLQEIFYLNLDPDDVINKVNEVLRRDLGSGAVQLSWKPPGHVARSRGTTDGSAA